MSRIPAITGWHWLRGGFVLFRKQPAEMTTLFMGYMFTMFVIGILPFLGQVLPLMLVPVFSMAFMHACRQIEQGQKVTPALLLVGFRSPALRSLVSLGALYFLAALIIVATSTFIDDGHFFKVMSGQLALDSTILRDTNFSLAMLFSAAISTPVVMAFWFAAPLIMWQNMGVGKALFYSFVASYRVGRPFMVYGLAWAVIGVLVPVLLSTLVALLLGSALLTMALLLPMTLIMTVVMYCSFYPMYQTIFAAPAQPSTNEPDGGIVVTLSAPAAQPAAPDEPKEQKEHKEP